MTTTKFISWTVQTGVQEIQDGGRPPYPPFGEHR